MSQTTRQQCPNIGGGGDDGLVSTITDDDQRHTPTPAQRVIPSAAFLQQFATKSRVASTRDIAGGPTDVHSQPPLFALSYTVRVAWPCPRSCCPTLTTTIPRRGLLRHSLLRLCCCFQPASLSPLSHRSVRILCFRAHAFLPSPLSIGRTIVCTANHPSHPTPGHTYAFLIMQPFRHPFHIGTISLIYSRR